MKSRLSRELEERLSLYLDGRLGAAERAEFERLIASNRHLREAVEFHRGLTLEFHEEAPPLPRGYVERARKRLEGAGATEGREGFRAPGPPWWRRGFTPQAAGAAAAVTLVIALLYPLLTEWGRRGRAGDTFEAPPAQAPAGSADQKALADKQTIEALRSLGYLGKGSVPPGQGVKKSPRREKPATPGAFGYGQVAQRERAAPKAPQAGDLAPPAAARAAAKVAPVPQAPAPEAPVQDQAAAAPPPGGAAPAATASEAASVPADAGGGGQSAAAQMSRVVAATSAASEEVGFRVMQVAKGPGPGSEFLAIRSAEEWKAFLSDAEAQSPAPSVEFDKDMVIVLRDDLKTDPPSRLRIAAVRQTAGDLVIECRVERAGPDSVAATAGQALLLAKTERRIRIVMKEGAPPG